MRFEPLCHQVIRINNDSENTIHALASLRYPDTGYLPLQASASFLIQNDAKVAYVGRRGELESKYQECWEYVYREKKELLSDTIMVAIYSDDLRLLKRMDLSLSDLRLMNFTIAFTGETTSKY